MKKAKVKIEISARHLHLCEKDLAKLFGKNYRLKRRNPLSQEGQFAAKETITLYNKNFKLEKVRVVGPLRKETQVEITLTEARKFRIRPPIKVSGNLKGSASLWLKGPKGKLKLKRGVIIAQRHLHASPEDAKKYKLKNKQRVSIKISGPRALTFHQVVVRIHPTFRWRFQIDTDEANAAGLKGGEEGIVMK